MIEFKIDPKTYDPNGLLELLLILVASGWTAFKLGAFKMLGEWMAKMALRMLPHPSKRKLASVYRMAALEQKVKDSNQTIRHLVRKQGTQDKALVRCQARETECKADFRNAMARIMVLERKAG